MISFVENEALIGQIFKFLDARSFFLIQINAKDIHAYRQGYSRRDLRHKQPPPD
jgi:hypothetical protein